MQNIPATFEQASSRANELWSKAKRCGDVLNAFPKGAMGLTPDEVKFSPPYRSALQEYEKARRDLQTYNTWYTKAFRAEIRRARTAKYSR